MIQRDVTIRDVTETGEVGHRDSFYSCLLGNPYLVPRAEFQVTKVINLLLTISQIISNVLCS